METGFRFKRCICPVCGKNVSANRDESVRMHMDSKPTTDGYIHDCPGSHMPITPLGKRNDEVVTAESH